MLVLHPLRRRQRTHLGIPIVRGHFAVVGHTASLLAAPLEFYRWATREAGPLFWIEQGFGRGLQLVYCDEASFDVFRSKSVESAHFREILGLFFGESLFVHDGPDHRRVRSVLSKPFNPRGLHTAGVSRLARDVVEASLAKWEGRSRVRILAETQDIALRIIFGVIGVKAEELGVWRRTFSQYAVSALGVPLHVPGSPNWWAIRARKWLDARLQAMVNQAREQPDADGLLAAMVRSRDDEGRGLTDFELIENLRIFVLAGHETTASSMAWMAIHLAHDPAVWARLCDEARELDDIPSTPDDLKRCPYAVALFREAVRMYPPVFTESRRVTHPLHVGDHEIPVGTVVAIPISLLAKNPIRYPDPDTFDPARWLDRPITPLETVTFGGGHHFCLGYHLALMEGTQFAVGLAKALGSRGRSLSPRGTIPQPRYVPLTQPPPRTSLGLVGGGIEGRVETPAAIGSRRPGADSPSTC